MALARARDTSSLPEWLLDPSLEDMAALFAISCREYSARSAYRVGNNWITYADCAARVAAISASLKDVLSEYHERTGKQPVIAVLLPNGHVVLESFFVAAQTHSIVLPINHRLIASEIETALRTSGATILLTSNVFENVLTEINWKEVTVSTIVWTSDAAELPVRDQRSWDVLLSGPETGREFRTTLTSDVFLQGFNTSGTTGKTKTVLHSHSNVRIHSLATIDALHLNPDDEHCWAHVGPMFHVGDAVFVWIAMLLGARHVFYENQFEIGEVSRLISAERVTIVKLVPSMLQLMCASDSTLNLDFSSLHWILTGGAAADSVLVRKTADRFGCDFIQGYGMTEATCHVAFKVETKAHATAGLRVLPGLQLRILDSRNDLAGPGNVGEIALKGETVFSGYVIDGTFEVGKMDGFTPDGYFLTGDLGYVDEAGNLHVVGRSKDMINVGGENVFAWEVEQAIRLMLNVEDCAAFPLLHEMLGEIVAVAVVRGDSAITVDEVKAHCRKLLASFKIPQRVCFLEALPRTTTGKVQKHLIVEQMSEATSTAGLAEQLDSSSLQLQSAAEVVEQIVSEYMRTFTPEPLSPDQSLFDAGLDSLGAIGLIDLFEQRFRTSMPPTLLYDHPTLLGLKKYFHSNEAANAKLHGQSDDDRVSPVNDETASLKSSTTPRSAVTLVTAVLQLIGLLIRPTLIALSVLPVLVTMDFCSNWLNRFELLAMGPLWLALFLTITMAIVLLFKSVIGRGQGSSCELWSAAYFRWLFLHNLFRSLEVPLGALRGTVVLNGFYRLCGARIGRGVRLDSITLQDLELITIDDYAFVGRDVNLQPAHIHEGMLLRQPIHLGSRCVLGPNVSVLGGARVAEGVHIPSLAVVRSSSHPSSTSVQKNISVVQQDNPPGVIGTPYKAIGFLISGYFATVAIFAGVMFVRGVVASLGAAVPSISSIALGEVSPSSVPLAFFAAVAIALYLVMPICYFALVVLLKRFVLEKLKPGTTVTDSWLCWSNWLYTMLVDVPFFKMYLRLTVGSHLTKWSFQLLGSQIGARPFLAAPYTAEPELLEMADFAMLAGNVSLYGVDIVSGTAEKIYLRNSAIVANSCVLHGGAQLAECSLLGDLSTAGKADVIPPNAIAVGVPPKIVGRTHFHPNDVSRGEYVRNQTLLILLQVALLAAANVAGFCVLGLLAKSFVPSGSAWAFWLALPALLLVPRLVKVLFLPLFKWTIVGKVSPGEHPLHGWFYTRWQLVETVMWDAEDAILGQLHGMPLLNLLWRALGARVGANACILSSSLACEYDLKDIGDAVVLNQQSLVFSHSIEHHSLLFRPTAIEHGAEIGSFAIVEAGGLVGAGRVVSPHVAIHANQVPRGSAMMHDAAAKREHQIEKAAETPSAINLSTRRPDNMARLSAMPIPEGDLKQRFQTLHEFVKAAREKLDRDNWDYLIGAAETETTYARNRLALDSLGLRPRVLRDVSDINCGATLFGKRLRIPVLCAPVGALESFDPDGAASVARAVDRFGIGLVVSSVSQPGLERTAAASGGALKVFQLYVRGDDAWVDDHIHRVIASGYDAFCLTVDTDLYSRRERDIAKRHERRRVRVANEAYQARFNWRDVARIKKTFEIPLILKGIATAEDAEIAIDHGVECIYVSNHGGRQLDHGLGSIAVLPEIVEAVAGRAKIIADGAITRGTDVVKAIALGADAVAVGRLYVYGLAAAGTPGVVRLFEILEDEIRICLGLLGVGTFAELSKKYVREAPAVVRAHLHSAFPHLDLPDETY